MAATLDRKGNREKNSERRRRRRKRKGMQRRGEGETVAGENLLVVKKQRGEGGREQGWEDD